MEKVNKTKNQHYVPQFILKKFCHNENDQIYVFDKLKQSIFTTNIRNVASENHFYDIGENNEISFEPLFTELDTKFSSIINKIIDIGNIKRLSEEEKIWIATYIAVQKIRTRNAREIIKTLSNDICNKLQELNIDPATVEGFDAFQSDEEIKKASLYNLNSIKEYIPYILNKCWILYKSESKFWISDNPVVMQNTINKNTVRGTLGFNVYGIEAYLPISPDYIIAFYCKNMIEDLFNEYQNNYEKLDILGHYELRNFVVSVRRKIPIEIKPESYENLNSLQIYNAERFIFSKENEFKLAKQMINDNNKFKTGPRPEIM